MTEPWQNAPEIATLTRIWNDLSSIPFTVKGFQGFLWPLNIFESVWKWWPFGVVQVVYLFSLCGDKPGTAQKTSRLSRHLYLRPVKGRRCHSIPIGELLGLLAATSTDRGPTLWSPWWPRWCSERLEVNAGIGRGHLAWELVYGGHTGLICRTRYEIIEEGTVSWPLHKISRPTCRQRFKH